MKEINQTPNVTNIFKGQTIKEKNMKTHRTFFTVILIAVVILFSVIALESIGQTVMKTVMKSVNPTTDSIVKKETVAKLVVIADSSKKVIAIQTDSAKIYRKQLHQAMQQDLYGGVKPIHFLIAYFFSILAMFVRWGLTIKTTLKTNTDTQVKFSWRTWIFGSLHKIMRIIAMLGLVFIFLRFTKEIIGFELSMLVAVGIGFFIDYLADKVMKIQPETIFKKLPEVKEETKTN